MPLNSFLPKRNLDILILPTTISLSSTHIYFRFRIFTQGPTKDYLCSHCLSTVKLRTVPRAGRRHTAKRKYVGPKEIPPPKIPRLRNYRKEACADINSNHYTPAFRLLAKENVAAMRALLRVAEELLQIEVSK